jgi:asparagine synthase (glutamine-hydrolysing)
MSTSDGRYTIIFNGEIYNYRELRRELQAEGIHFMSHTDTEVLLLLYARRGTECLRLLRGMFAFAIRDNETRKVLIGRDPLGIKPLYYHHTESLFIFASELRSVLASELLPRRLSRAGLDSYLRTGSVSSPLTIIEGIHLVQPGHYMTVVPGTGHSLEVKEISYTEGWFRGACPPPGLNREAATEALREALKESVRVHLESDVPLGPFLSGGIDSSALVALMSQVTRERPKTFSVVFADEKFSEAVYAREVAKQFDTEHHEIHLTEHQLFDILPTAINAEDQPTMDGINTFVVSKAVRESGITVALSGLGGDELFAGYPTFRRAVRMQTATRFPGLLRQGISSIGERFLGRSVQQKKLWQLLASDGGPAAAYAISRQLFPSAEVETLLAEDAKLASATLSDSGILSQADDPINDVSRFELTGYMANTLLRDTDSMSMAHSLEVRVPFVDIEIVRFVLQLPGSWKLGDSRSKPLLQDALGDLLPASVMNRSKMGFMLPFESWMQSRLRGQIETTFADEKHFESIGLRPGAVRNVWREFLRSPRRVGWSRPWALHALGHWCKHHQVIL